MNSRQRVWAALNHQEPDRVPFDLGGTTVTGIHVTAYQNLREYLGLPPVQGQIDDLIEQLAGLDDDIAGQLEPDCGRVAPGLSSSYKRVFREEGDYVVFADEWGIDWAMPKQGGFFYDMVRHPLAEASSIGDLRSYRWPDPLDPGRFAGLGERARALRRAGKAVVLAPHCVGPTEMHAFLRGWYQYYLDFALNPGLVEYLLDQIVELKLGYWEQALREVGDDVDVVMEADDFAGQQRMLISPDTFRTMLKPRYVKLFGFIREHTAAKLFLHSCGAMRPVIGDLIDCGVEILNPVQKSAAGMDLGELKQEFGRDLVFWGGGVDTQRVFATGTPDQVREDVRQNIEALAPGGGFVFATIHNTQANVPPENFMAMWQALRTLGAAAYTPGTGSEVRATA
jgi:uroporphyrinogen decarboxylase